MPVLNATMTPSDETTEQKSNSQSNDVDGVDLHAQSSIDASITPSPSLSSTPPDSSPVSMPNTVVLPRKSVKTVSGRDASKLDFERVDMIALNRRLRTLIKRLKRNFDSTT